MIAIIDPIRPAAGHAKGIIETAEPEPGA